MKWRHFPENEKKEEEKPSKLPAILGVITASIGTPLVYFGGKKAHVLFDIANCSQEISTGLMMFILGFGMIGFSYATVLMRD